MSEMCFALRCFRLLLCCILAVRFLPPIQWRSALEEKYTALTGINSFHDFIIAKGSPLVTLKVKGQCYKGLYEVATIRKPDFDKTSTFRPVSYESNAPSLTDQKLQQIKEQYGCYIKADTVGYIRPAFLVPLETVNPVCLAPSVNKNQTFVSCM